MYSLYPPELITSEPQGSAVQESGVGQPTRRWLTAGYAPQRSFVAHDLECVVHNAQVVRVPLLVCTEAPRLYLRSDALQQQQQQWQQQQRQPDIECKYQ
jgi:hypothetical protein